jgi:dTDP-glucose 4,6-dehydratase
MGRVVVTGGAGFIGSHLCERLHADAWDVIVVDSLITGSHDNLDTLKGRARFSFVEADITQAIPVTGGVDRIVHLASPASPMDYLRNPLETLEAGSSGTRNALELSRASGARFLLASTSEIYGDPEIHPQPESYWGKVNPIGPRAVYDESKRFAEAITMTYHRVHGLDVRIARLFNTYGPRMRRGDGRAVPTFIEQALMDEPITLHGDGSQTRSLCYVNDTVDGLLLLMESSVEGPVNLGNPDELTMRELAARICGLVGADVDMKEVDRPQDDPELRRPDITRARELLGWRPIVRLDDGLRRTIEWARSAWAVD